MCRSWSGGSGGILRPPNKRAPRDRASARREALKVQPLRFAQFFWCSLPEIAEPDRFGWEGSDGVADSFARRGESEARAGWRPVTSEQRRSCGRRRSQHDRSNSIVLAEARSRSAGVLVGLRGIGPALAGKLGRFSLGASRQSQGVRFQSSLRTHPAPPAYLLLGIGPALAGR